MEGRRRWERRPRVSDMHVLVRGRVQGVGFRWFVAEQARALGVTGWVRNNDDGAVEVAARGSETALASLRSAVSRGPAAAQVDCVEDMPSPGEIAGEAFRVLR